MYSVKELSKVAGVTPETVRYYVKISFLKPIRNPDNGYKLFNKADLQKLVFIKQAKQLGFTLRDIRSIFEYINNEESPCLTVRHLISQRIEEKKVQLSELNHLIHKMEIAINSWKEMPDDKPNGEAICRLIESISDEATTQNVEVHHGYK